MDGRSIDDREHIGRSEARLPACPAQPPGLQWVIAGLSYAFRASGGPLQSAPKRTTKAGNVPSAHPSWSSAPGLSAPPGRRGGRRRRQECLNPAVVARTWKRSPRRTDPTVHIPEAGDKDYADPCTTRFITLLLPSSHDLFHISQWDLTRGAYPSISGNESHTTS